ncbi:tRNA (cytosine(38)-C(5))-methyltransferase [Nematolebias whitei]|uniref:tRNA (cytosine(38)-C(5))-methyltransferase n=1 Tax=Nematolebias whitei TaxID=451745 RepID=UPI0018982627|nr:tRNA (cytosine(38)-C(5))-methyltransferase [Nematolebias whitei]
MCPTMGDVRVLELYSGVGGMHFALKESGVPAQVVAAIDINTTANQIYKHNFPDTPVWSKTIEGMTLDDFNKLSVDMIMMSPPCQPFTRLGLQGDIGDPRTKSFLYILDLLPRLHKLPRFILLENVKGFESSSARDRLVQTLMDCSYSFQEFMVSPTHIGIPNSRLRYFLIAKISAENPKVSCSALRPAESEVPSDSNSTCSSPSQLDEKTPSGHVLFKLETAMEAQRKVSQNNDLSVRQIQDFLEPMTEENMNHYLLAPKTLLRYGLILDIVQPKCRRSVCFTKGYGRYVEGTGSVLQCCLETEIEGVFTGLDQLSETDKLEQLLKLKLRYFTPREVANLMGFPPHFTFPKSISTIQRYKVLGNSLNVAVVARLVQLLLSEHAGRSTGDPPVLDHPFRGTPPGPPDGALNWLPSDTDLTNSGIPDRATKVAAGGHHEVAWGGCPSPTGEPAHERGKKAKSHPNPARRTPADWRTPLGCFSRNCQAFNFGGTPPGPPDGALNWLPSDTDLTNSGIPDRATKMREFVRAHHFAIPSGRGTPRPVLWTRPEPPTPTAPHPSAGPPSQPGADTAPRDAQPPSRRRAQVAPSTTEAGAHDAGHARPSGGGDRRANGGGRDTSRGPAPHHPFSNPIEGVFTGLDQLSETDKLEQLLKLKLRYFTPREVANLMGFPPHFTFPKSTSTIQRYKVLGNSLNVAVVARLVQLLLSEHAGRSTGDPPVLDHPFSGCCLSTAC